MKRLYRVDYASPIGVIELVGTDQEIISLLFSEKETTDNVEIDEVSQVMKECYKQVEEYFQGKRKAFTFPYLIEGTTFQQNVWKALTDIPYGETGSYQDIAISIGNQRAVRAVGNANRNNKLCIVIPCHRIIGKNGSLTGYAGGLWRKEWLLEHEKSMYEKNLLS